jgi:hypothetical protein
VGAAAKSAEVDLLSQKVRETIATALLVIACLVIAIALFLAGAMWRARVTAYPRAPVSGAP